MTDIACLGAVSKRAPEITNHIMKVSNITNTITIAKILLVFMMFFCT